jgi:hypothetical protein
VSDATHYAPRCAIGHVRAAGNASQVLSQVSPRAKPAGIQVNRFWAHTVTSRGMSPNKLVEELSTAALAVHDAETRFLRLAAAADRSAALKILTRLDERDR